MKRLFLLMLPLMLAAGCKSQYEALLASSNVEAKYAAAMNYFNTKKYSKSAQLFESLSVQVGGTPREDTVQYYWGLSNYRFKDYFTAETNFTKFLQNFPRSPFTEDARFLRLDCLYRSTYRYELDQTPTRAALIAIEEYMREYKEDTPHLEACRKMQKDLNDRLDQKAFESARLYYKMEDYKASRVAFKNVLKDDSENIYREQILYYTAMSSYHYARLSVQKKQKDRYLVFADDYLNFIGEYPESKYRRELDVMYKRSQNALGRYTGSQEELKAKEREFERERRQIERAEKSENKKNETSAKNKQ